jgi:diguanylate cyclase (GGDEF)-like protein
VRAVNERHAHEERLAFLSKFDSLTGEMNRVHLTEMLTEAVEEAIRFRNSCAFLLVAIDNLTRVNEAYGFKVADEVIAAVAGRMRQRMRGGDMLGRFSGNKFGLILRGCTVEEVAVAAERLLRGVRDEVVQTSCGPIAVTVSIGGVIAPRHARDVQETLARAQEALESAKTKRQGSFFAYRPSVEREAQRLENVRATDEIVAALNERRVLLAFEPVVDTVTRAPVFYESLMRIRRADGTLVSAAAAIPIAERLGLVRLIDHRVMELVVEELVRHSGVRLSINVSPASTGDPDWWEGLCAHLRAHPGAAERLTVEITEIAEIRDVDETRGFVSRVKDLGCRIAIDDFGAGYTSFRNLRKLGVDIIKIDGAFVQNLTRSPDDRTFVRTLVELGRALNLTTVAEWVQNEEAAALLAGWGCDCLQGALVGLASTEPPWADAAAGRAGTA